MPGEIQHPNRFSLLTHLGMALQRFPEVSFAEALSSGQVESKKWLIETLERERLELGTVFVLGGWWGLLPAMLFESDVKFEKIRSFDIDPACAPVADTINRKYVKDDWRFKASTADMLKIDYRNFHYQTMRADGTSVAVSDSPTCLINTSCEHIGSFSDWWAIVPEGMLVILQSNNFRAIAEHCNCHDSLDGFAASAPMSRVLYRGELDLPDYKRFMLVGHK